MFKTLPSALLLHHLLQPLRIINNPSGDVQYGRETVERLFSVTAYIHVALLALLASGVCCLCLY